MLVENMQLTPLMQQYMVIRKQYSDHLLLFQVGDFYELFFDDAKRASAFLGIALTKRGQLYGEPIPLCGVPVHALQHYLVKLVRGGFKVAICDQLEEAVPGKVVQRGVTQVLTPGTLTDTQLLDEKTASYICSFFPLSNSWGVLFSELMTAQLIGTVLPAGEYKRLESEMCKFMPDELLIPPVDSQKEFASYFKQLGYFTSLEHVDQNNHEQQHEFDGWLSKQFHSKTHQLLDQQMALKAALHSFYTYIKKNNLQAVDQFRTLSWYDADDFLIIDSATQKNLELVRNKNDNSKKGTLFAVLDRAITPMGSRMLNKWITRPLVKQEQIVKRQQVVELFTQHMQQIEPLEDCFKEVGDIERVVGRIALKRAKLGDFIALRDGMAQVPDIVKLMTSYGIDTLLQSIYPHLLDFASLHQLLDASLYYGSDRAWIIKNNFDQELDRLRDLIEHSNDKLLQLEQEEQRKTGIGSLKVGFTNVFGYYIEVTKANLHLVPSYYVRQQTLANRERYTMPALQQLQMDIQEARTHIDKLESEIFERIKKEVEQHSTPLRKLAQLLAHIDAFRSLASIAWHHHWVKPIFNDHRSITITDSRHPVIELLDTKPFIPNDVVLDDTQSLLIITGPNMGGKSTYLRQVALLSVLAQMGSFVPAKKANIFIVDRIFTRIGSGDNLVEGKSTFLVEMEETATICTQATNRSLVILDEVGRGTSTFDGLAIAQAVVEYIYAVVGARALFATHYHELTQLEKQFSGIVSYQAASKKTDQGITFLYKIKRGVADGSFGIQVAKLAQLPSSVVDRAQQIVEQLEAQELLNVPPMTSSVLQPVESVVLLQQRCTELERRLQLIQEIDCNDLSPKKAFDLIWQLKQM